MVDSICSRHAERQGGHCGHCGRRFVRERDAVVPACDRAVPDQGHGRETVVASAPDDSCPLRRSALLRAPLPVRSLRAHRRAHPLPAARSRRGLLVRGRRLRPRRVHGRHGLGRRALRAPRPQNAAAAGTVRSSGALHRALRREPAAHHQRPRGAPCLGRAGARRGLRALRRPVWLGARGDRAARRGDGRDPAAPARRAETQAPRGSSGRASSGSSSRRPASGSPCS